MVRGGFDSTYVVTLRIVWLAVWHVRCGKGLQDKRYKPKENQKCKPQFEEMSTTLSCKSLQLLVCTLKKMTQANCGVNLLGQGANQFQAAVFALCATLPHAQS